MPRKQRFKPSRKPKPIPQNEEPMSVRQPSSAPTHGGSPDHASVDSDLLGTEPEIDDRSY
jgi:hypothetical protein